MTIEELKLKSLEELKAIAYDQIVAVRNMNDSLQIVNNLIQEKSINAAPVQPTIPEPEV